MFSLQIVEIVFKSIYFFDLFAKKKREVRYFSSYQILILQTFVFNNESYVFDDPIIEKQLKVV